MQTVPSPRLIFSLVSAEDKAFFNLILRVSHALNLVPRAPRAFVTDFRYPCPAMLDYHRCSRKEPALLEK